MDRTTHYLIEKKTYFWRVNKLPGGNHTFPAELEVEFTDTEPSLSVTSVKSLSQVRLFETPWTAACQPSLSVANFWSLLKLMSIESLMPSNHVNCLSQHQGLFQ